MSGRTWRRHAIRKDVRALAPTWFMSVVVMVGGKMVFGTEVSVFGYLLGSVLLGALIIGHEYSNRTLAGLLSLPVPRAQILITKAGVLAVFLVTLSAIAVVTDSLHVYRTWRGSPWPAGLASFGPTFLLVAPAFCALTVAPWFTMLGRSSLAGAVFSSAAVSMTWFVGEIIGILRLGPAQFWTAQMKLADDVEAFRTSFGWYGTTALCVLSAVGSWWTFARLQANDGRSMVIPLPQWISAQDADDRVSVSTGQVIIARRRHHWLVSLVRKELRSQSLLFAVAGLYTLAWYALVETRPFVPEFFRLPLMPLTLLFGVAVGLLLGSFASAEERQLGMTTMHALLPVAGWRQWTAKVAVVLGLAAVLGVGLPLLLQSLVPGLFNSYDVMPDYQPAVVLMLAAGSLYVSSVTTSGLRALVTSMAALTAAAGIAGFVEQVVRKLAMQAFTPVWHQVSLTSLIDRHQLINLANATPIAFCTIALLIAIGFAMKNHWSADNGARRVARQVAWLLAVVVLSGVLKGGVQAAAYKTWRNAGRDAVRMSGRIEFEGSASPPLLAILSRLSMVLVPPKSMGLDEAVPVGIKPDGTFGTGYTFRGRYMLRVSWPPSLQPWRVKSATWHGRDIWDTPIDIRESVSDLVVTLSDSSAGTITGTVAPQAGLDARLTALLMFPEDRSIWWDYGWLSRRVTARSAGSEGVFSMPMPPDGDYLLVAVPGLQVREFLAAYVSRNGWFFKDPAPILTRLAPTALHVKAVAGTTITMSVPVTNVR